MRNRTIIIHSIEDDIGSEYDAAETFGEMNMVGGFGDIGEIVGDGPEEATEDGIKVLADERDLVEP